MPRNDQLARLERLEGRGPSVDFVSVVHCAPGEVETTLAALGRAGRLNLARAGVLVLPQYEPAEWFAACAKQQRDLLRGILAE